MYGASASSSSRVKGMPAPTTATLQFLSLSSPSCSSSEQKWEGRAGGSKREKVLLLLLFIAAQFLSLSSPSCSSSEERESHHGGRVCLGGHVVR